MLTSKMILNQRIRDFEILFQAGDDMKVHENIVLAQAKINELA